MRARPWKSTRRRSAKHPKAANRLTWGLSKTTCVNPKAAGMTTAARSDRLTARAPGSFAANHRASLDPGRSPTRTVPLEGAERHPVRTGLTRRSGQPGFRASTARR